MFILLYASDMDAASCRYQKAGSFPHVLHATTPKQYLAASHSHHQWGNPGDNRIDAIARYPVQAEGIIVLSCRPTQSRCSCPPRPTDADGPFHWSEARRQMANDHWSTTKKPGAPKSGLMSERLLVNTGMPVSCVATVAWRNGPQGLHDDDDDDVQTGGTKDHHQLLSL